MTRKLGLAAAVLMMSCGLFGDGNSQDTSLERVTVELLKPDSDNVDLHKLLAEQAQTAAKTGRVPFAYLWLHVCSHCLALNAAYDNPRMKAAMQGTHIVRISLDDWDVVLDDPDFNGSDKLYTPSFWQILPDGSVGNSVDGRAWGQDIPAEMAPPLALFFRQHGVDLPQPTSSTSPIKSKASTGAEPVLPPPVLKPAQGEIPEGAVLERADGGIKVYRVPAEQGED